MDHIHTYIYKTYLTAIVVCLSVKGVVNLKKEIMSDRAGYCRARQGKARQERAMYSSHHPIPNYVRLLGRVTGKEERHL